MDLLDTAIESDRLSLEPLAPAHAPLLFDGLQDEAIYRWISARPPESLPALRERFARNAARRAEAHPERQLAWAARLRSDGTCIGQLDADVVGDEATNVGYLLLPPHWGLGYATEATSALVAHLARCGVRRWRATVTVGNTASARVLERTGFTYTRTLKDNDTLRGEPCDDWEFVLTRSPETGLDGSLSSRKDLI